MRIVPGSEPQDLGQVDALEKIVKSILQRLLSLEEKVEILESRQQRIANSTSSLPAVAGGPVSYDLKAVGTTKTLGDDVLRTPPLELNTEAIKKGLLCKMWKYLNDERSRKAA